MSGRKVFAVGEVLQAADVNDFLMDQSVMVFPGSAARGSAIPSPTEGMVTYLSDSDEVEVFDGSVYKPVGAGQILQVVSTTKTDTFSTSSTSMADVTGLSATITPSSTSSKILVCVSAAMANTPGVNDAAMQIVRDSTAIFIGDVAGSRVRASMPVASPGPANGASVSINYLDSPSTTTATTYKVQMRVTSSNGYVNRSSADSDNSFHHRYASTITLMEVAG